MIIQWKVDKSFFFIIVNFSYIYKLFIDKANNPSSKKFILLTNLMCKNESFIHEITNIIQNKKKESSYKNCLSPRLYCKKRISSPPPPLLQFAVSNLM